MSALMKSIVALPLLVISVGQSLAQPSIQIGPGGVQIDPGGRREFRERREPREEQIVREEGGCRIVIVRRFDEYEQRTTRRTRECEDDVDD